MGVNGNYDHWAQSFRWTAFLSLKLGESRGYGTPIPSLSPSDGERDFNVWF
jgi:hypothetical protein